eukprot:13699533-Ditylum_brightwellii.AAC.1
MGGEGKKAKDGTSRLVKVIQFLTENQDKIIKGQAAKYSNSVLLKMAKNCICTKLNKSVPKVLTIAMLQIELKKAEAALYAFPRSWWKRMILLSERQSNS